MSAYAQVLGTATGDTTPSVILVFDDRRYLFNCGEGSQRYCTEHKIRLKKVEHVFLTELSWDLVGGLPGMIMTVSDAGSPKLAITGPPNTKHLLNAMRFYLHRPRLEMNVTEFQSLRPSDITDENVTISPVLLDPDAKAASGGSMPEERSILRPVKAGYRKRRRAPEPPGEDPGPARKRTKRAGSEEAEMTGEADADVEVDMSDSGSAEGANAAGTATAVAATAAVASGEDAKGKRAAAAVVVAGASASEAPVASPAPAAAATVWEEDETREGVETFSDDVSRVKTRARRAVASYACRLPPARGKFFPQKAKELGISPGPLYGKLQRGETVTLDSGLVVRPEDVMGPPVPGPIVLVVRCPSEDHAALLPDAFVGVSEAACVFHMTPQSVLSTPRYKKWMHTFAPATQHVVINEDVCPQRAVFLGATANQIKLHRRVAQDVFAFPHYDASSRAAALPEDLPERTVAGDCLLKFHLAPARTLGLDATAVLPDVSIEAIDAELDELLADLPDTPTAAIAAAVASKLAAHAPHTPSPTASRLAGASLPEFDFAVTFLGTGSSLPSKYRNVSSTYLNLTDPATQQRWGLLMDAGEGTYGQMRRRWGAAETDNVLRGIRCVFVSHIHADHHLGLVRVLRRRRELGCEATLVIGPSPVRQWLDEFGDIEDLHTNFLCCDEGEESRVAARLTSWGLPLFQPVRVVHCAKAYGLVIQHATGWKLVFSGDTRPCDRLIEAGTGATLLIHEATFEDDMHSMAVRKRHATSTEAIASAEQMKAAFVVLNHFSQRYPKIPVFDDSHNSSTGVSFDLMTVHYSQLPRLPAFAPLLQRIFPADD